LCSIKFCTNYTSGSVKDSNNEPIPGANITVKGDNAGAVSDADGKFTLLTKPPFTIEISSVGYGVNSVEITLHRKSSNYS
jgi:hypothetical protein